MNVRGQSADQYARYALLVIYAWDMCDANPDPVSDVIDPRILADGWTVVGIISADDRVIGSAPGGIRQSVIRPGPDQRRYGYVALNGAGDTYVVAIRGTDGAEEWIDDFVFTAAQKPPLPGSVETGFADIYFSMQYRALGGGPSVTLADGVKAVVGAKDVVILGHSLGSTLAEALTYELADPGSLGAARVGAVVFASPKLGDQDFVTAFDARVAEYIVINYEHDVVPRVPPFDITHFDLYRTLPHCFVIVDEAATAVINSADKGCCHHLIDYIAMLSPAEYNRSIPSWTADERQCATCIVSVQ